MLGKTHLAYGVAIGVSVCYKDPFVIGFASLGSLLPDIDYPESLLGRIIPVIPKVIPHRTITHALWIPLVLTGVYLYYPSIYLLSLILGYIGHLIQDSFTKDGVKWFYPKLKIKGFIKTGSFLEYIITALLMGITIFASTIIK